MKIKHLSKYHLLFVLIVFAYLGIWESVARFEIVNPLLFPSPLTVFQAFCQWMSEGGLFQDLYASFFRLLSGFVVGGTVGIAIGMLTGRVTLVRQLLGPLIQFLRPLPPVAIIPMIIVWLGIGDTAKIFSISFAVFFPVWINTHMGALSIPESYLWSANLLSKSKLKIVVKVLMPAALPHIVAGLRTSIAIAFIMVYVSEIAGPSSGIGYQISISHLAYRIDKMIAALIVLTLFGAAADFVFINTINLIFPWMKLRGHYDN